MLIRFIFITFLSFTLITACSEDNKSKKSDNDSKISENTKTSITNKSISKIDTDPEIKSITPINNTVINKSTTIETSSKQDKLKEKTPEIVKGTLLFFMNPNGAPCIAQNDIISSISDELEKTVDIVYIKTTDHISRMTFDRYGIRRLPSIIVLNSAGDIHKTFPPGIQAKELLINATTF